MFQLCKMRMLRKAVILKLLRYIFLYRFSVKELDTRSSDTLEIIILMCIKYEGYKLYMKYILEIIVQDSYMYFFTD